MTSELRPCPFCGSGDVEVHETITDAMVACNNCGSRTGLVFLGASDAENAAKIREAVAIWNGRTLPVMEEREGLKITPAKPVVLEDDRDIYGDTAPVEGGEA
jgi:Lar family restriction alleviation protein